MGKDSLTSLLILLVLFIVLPSALKLLGQFTMSSKNPDRKGPPEPEVRLPEEDGYEYPAEPSIHHDYERLQKDTFSNRPIHPRWF